MAAATGAVAAMTACCVPARLRPAPCGGLRPRTLRLLFVDHSQDSQATVAADSQATAGTEPQATVADIIAWPRAREP